MRFIFRLLITAAALWAATQFVSGISFDGDWRLLFAVALIFGVLNAIVRPILKLLTLPIVIITLGLFLLFVNMAVLALTDWLVSGFNIEGFWTFVGATIVVWIVNAVLEAAASRVVD